jgi:hypothetical protein
MPFYRLSEAELQALERDPASLPDRLKAWRREIDAQKAQKEKTKSFIAEQAARTGEVW